MAKLFVKRGTRAQIDAAAVANELNEGELYLITDESRLAVGTGIDSYIGMTYEGEPDLPNLGDDLPVEPAGFYDRTQCTLSFNSTTKVFTIAPVGDSFIFFVQSHYIESIAQTVDLDISINGDSTPLVTNTLYYVYFDENGGLKVSTSPWSIIEGLVPVATIYWNGSDGAIADERHGIRDLAWHRNAHLTIGTRYVGGFGITAPTTSVDGQLDLQTGQIMDEDLYFNITNQVRCRLWREVSAGVWTWVDGTDNSGKDRPYFWSGTNVQLNNASYALTALSNAQFTNVYVYATGDITRPIYIVTPTVSAAFTTIALARAATPPASLPFTAEAKLLYRFIYRGDGEFQEATDYRSSSPLPSGGTGSVLAGNVIFTPAGGVAAVNVQQAIEEVDSEKVAGPASVTDLMIALFDGVTGKLVKAALAYIDSVGRLVLPSGAGLVVNKQSNTPVTVTNGVVIGAVAKDVAGGCYVQFRGNDPVDWFGATIEITSSATPAERRLRINAVEQNVGYRNVCIAEAGGNVGVGIQVPLVKLDVQGDGIQIRAAATLDGIKLTGRAGGNQSYEVIVVPAALTSDRTLTLPDATGTVELTGHAHSTMITAAATLDTDNVLVRADGTSRGVQKSGITISDTNEVHGDGTKIDNKTASYSLLLADAGKTIEMNVGSANNLTVPLNSSQAFPIGTVINIIQQGAGQTTVVATGGVTIRSSGSKLKITGQYSMATLVKRATDEWYLAGDIAS